VDLRSAGVEIYDEDESQRRPEQLATEIVDVDLRRSLVVAVG